MFKNAPTPQEFKEGDDAVIVCDVVSSLPPTIIWKHKGRDVILKKDGKVSVLVHSGVKCPSPIRAHTQNAGGNKGQEKQFVPDTRPWDVSLVLPGAVVWQWQGNHVPTEMAIRLWHWNQPRNAGKESKQIKEVPSDRKAECCDTLQPS